MKKIAILFFSLTILGGVGVYSASATSVNISENVPSTGSVTLDDDDKVIAASSPELFDLVKKSEETNIEPRAAINYKNGRWVYYSDNHNPFNGYKEGYSSYIHRKEYHGAYATVGGSGQGWKYANANVWAKSKGAGKGTFVAKYDAPYN